MESEIHNSMHCKSRRCEGCRCPRARKLRSINLQIAEAMAEILRILADCPTREESRPSWFQEKQSEQELPTLNAVSLKICLITRHSRFQPKKFRRLVHSRSTGTSHREAGISLSELVFAASNSDTCCVDE